MPERTRFVNRAAQEDLAVLGPMANRRQRGAFDEGVGASGKIGGDESGGALADAQVDGGSGDTVLH